MDKRHKCKMKRLINRTLMKLKILLREDPVMRMKRQITHLKKIFANHISDKGLISGIYNKLSKLNIKRKLFN